METKVKIFASTNGVDLEKAINEFIKDKILIDIKYQSFGIHTQFNRDNRPTKMDIFDRALVIYIDNVI